MENFDVTFAGGLRVDATYRGFTIATDQPLPAGGDNTAPSPFDLFLASLATCAGFFVVSFCRQRNIPTEGIKVVQRMERDPQSHMVSKVEIEVQLPATFPEQYQSAVVRAADLCTVKRHLQNPPTIVVNAKTVAEPANLG